MKARKSIAWMGTLALLLAVFSGFSFTMNAADNPDSEQVSKLLSDAKTMAFQVQEDAQSMETFARSGVSWQGHATQVAQIKEHLNTLGQQVAKLKAARGTASPWQQVAIDRIDPYLDEMEGYTSAVIEHLHQHPELISTPKYRDYVEANADYATDLATMIANFVDYGKTKDRLQQLTDKLEVPAS